VKAIASVLYGVPAMLLDLRIDQLPKMRPEPSVGAFLIRCHKTRVARHIGGENGGQPAFDAFRGQSGAPRPHGPKRLSAFGAHSNGKRDWLAFLFGEEVRPAR
jgi:hypothetical protein